MIRRSIPDPPTRGDSRPRGNSRTSLLSFFQPNPGAAAPCPICGRPRPHSERYPDAVCAECVDRATDEAGRRLIFSNLFPESLGGFQALYADTRERLHTPDDRCACLIDGVRCVAREAYFGGIVVVPVSAQMPPWGETAD